MRCARARHSPASGRPAEGDRIDVIRSTGQRPDQGAVGDPPQPSRRIVAAAREPAAIGREGDADHGLIVTGEAPDHMAAGDVP